MDDHTILNVRVRTDDDGFHVALCVHLVCANYGVGTHEHVLVHDHAPTHDGGRVNKGTRMNLRQITARVLPDHARGHSGNGLV